MRITTFLPTDYIPEAVREFLGRRAAEAGGLTILASVSAVGLALATWSIQDPSWNHAVDGPARNLMGPAGAVTADLIMQLIGISVVAILPPIAWCGWHLVTRRHLDHPKLRLLLLILGGGAATALASALPTTDRWPLPSGLGGIVGDAILAVPRHIFGTTQPSQVMTAVVLAGAAILLLTAAAGFGLKPSPVVDDDDAIPTYEWVPVPKSLRQPFEDEDESVPSRALVPFGALIHALLSLKAQGLRLLRRGRDHVAPQNIARAPWLDRQADSPFAYETPFDHALHTGSERTEPTFGPSFAPPKEDRDRGAYGTPHGPEPVPGARSVSPGARPSPRGQGSGATGAGAPGAGAHIAGARIAGARIAGQKAGRGAAPPGPQSAATAEPPFDRAAYRFPPTAILPEAKRGPGLVISEDALGQNARLLEGVLEDFGVKGEIINVRPGPVVTLYELEPAAGIKSSRVIGLADDIARSMSAISARVAVVQGRNVIGIELPNQRRDTVVLRELIESHDFRHSKHKLPIALGKTIGGEAVIVDLARMPHLLVAGTTGSGKSVAINTMILSILYRLKPEECRLIMIDPKMLELSGYDGIPHLLTPVVRDPKKAVAALKWAVREMEDRYKKMSKVGVRNIDGFNLRVSEALARGESLTRTVQIGYDRDSGEAVYEQERMSLSVLPYIVIVVDEMADLMMAAGKEIESAVQRLAQMARAAGIHLIMATQRPSADVITATIKANFPTRVSFQVTSKIDSRTILGEQGAEQLLGQGDMLYMAGGGRIARVHGPFVSDGEVETVVAHLKTQGRPHYLDAVTEDGGFEAQDEDQAALA